MRLGMSGDWQVVYAGACAEAVVLVRWRARARRCVGLCMSWHAYGDELAWSAMVGWPLCCVAYVGTCADFPMIVPNAGL